MRRLITTAIINAILRSLFAATAIHSLPARAQLADAPSTPARSFAKAETSFQQLKGRWQRTDGGYIVEIKGVAPGGKLNTTYFNPRPIRVTTAEASQRGGQVNVLIELRDVNYPGSTYRLTYDRQSDRLTGTYFQAALKQSFVVSFLRVTS